MYLLLYSAFHVTLVCAYCMYLFIMCAGIHFINMFILYCVTVYLFINRLEDAGFFVILKSKHFISHHNIYVGKLHKFIRY